MLRPGRPQGIRGTIAATASEALELSVRDGEIQYSPCRKMLSIKRGTSSKIGTVRVGRKIVVGGIAETVSEAFEQGIRHVEIQDNSR